MRFPSSSVRVEQRKFDTFSLFLIQFQARESCFAALILSIIIPQPPNEELMLARTKLNPPSRRHRSLHFIYKSTPRSATIRGKVTSGWNGRYLHPMPGRQCSGCALMAGQYGEWPQPRVSLPLDPSICVISWKCYLYSKCTNHHIISYFLIGWLDNPPLFEESFNSLFWVPVVLGLNLNPDDFFC